MKIFRAIYIGMMLAIVFPAVASAQVFDLNKARATEPSTLFPMLPQEDLGDTPENKIPDDRIEKIYKRCLTRIPVRFTNDALYDYCACSAAATSANISMTELQELQSRKNWKLGNKTFEKYATQVITPCLDTPIQDMEYMSCILYRSNDWRVDRIPSYCQCVSIGVREYVKKFGDTDIMIEWGNSDKQYEFPIDALWYSPEYNRQKNRIRENCVGSFRRYDPYKGGPQ